jgi:hypothetical protein
VPRLSFYMQLVYRCVGGGVFSILACAVHPP